MADESNSTPSPAPATDPLVALVARWHGINAALAATGDPAEQDRLAAELRNVECMMMATPATTAPGAVAGWELARHIRAQPACDRNHRAALYIALLENAADGLCPSRWCKLGDGHQHCASGRGQRGNGHFIISGHASHGLQVQVTVL